MWTELAFVCALPAVGLLGIAIGTALANRDRRRQAGFLRAAVEEERRYPLLSVALDDPTPDDEPVEPGPDTPAWLPAEVWDQAAAAPAAEPAGEDGTVHGASGSVQVGRGSVHRSCADARRDGRPDRICAYCYPFLFGSAGRVGGGLDA